MKYLLFYTLLIILGCQAPSSTPETLSQFQLSFKTIADSIHVLGEDIISTAQNQRDFALSPQEDELFYTLVSPKNQFSAIIQLKKVAGKWSMPEVAPFSGKYSDLEPAYTPDGKKLFFASNRPTNGSEQPKDYDIWYVEKENGAWSQAANIGAPVNTDKDEFFPSVASNGNLYFTAAYESSKGLEDIYKSKWKKNQFQTPVSLDTSINTKAYEFNAYISPDENLIIFSSFGREDGFGGGDLYLAQKNQDDKWVNARNLGNKINSDKLDYCPFVDLGQNVFYFTSEKNSIQKHYPEGIGFQEFNSKINFYENGLGTIYFTDFKSLKIK